jgi:hypothetical protein
LRARAAGAPTPAGERSPRASRQAATATRRASTLCSAPTGRQLRDHGGLEHGELGGILVRQHDVFPCLQGVSEDIQAENILPSGVVGPRDLAPFLRLASAHPWLMETAAGRAAPTPYMTGFLAG